MILNSCLIFFLFSLLFHASNSSISLENLSVASSSDQRRILATTSTPILNETSIIYSSSLRLYFDPPSGHSSPTALGLFVWTSSSTALIYYEVAGVEPSLNSTYVTPNSYIQLGTPFKASRNRTITIVAVDTNQFGTFRSKQYVLKYFVEGAARPYSYGFLVPGIESGGYFLRFGIEMAATARAQAAGGQEFADFFSDLGYGTYPTQVQALDLLSLDPELSGFEGGFPVNTSDGKYYGILIPYHNGVKFFGKLVRVDLQAMANTSQCLKSYRNEFFNATSGKFETSGNTLASDACVTVLDLESMESSAVGFRRGFLGFPYGYLSAGQYSTIVRLNLESFTLQEAKFIDLSKIDKTYGGYSGGFADGTWACFSPFKTFAGPVGGIRSNLPIDRNLLSPYFYSTMLCINETGWTASLGSEKLLSSIQTIDFSTIEESFRGFSDALRVGRYAYLAPYSSSETTYVSKLIRITLGTVDIGTTLNQIYSSGGSIRSIIDILDLSKLNPNLKGFSGLFSSGQYLILVPYRNAYEPTNGQRGHGYLTRLNMNEFSLAGIDFMNMPVTTRNQIPSFADVNLRGYSYGFPSGHYGLLVPFFNGDFDGKVARFYSINPTLGADLQELDLQVDRTRPNVYRGYRGGFVSLWQGVDF